jgi:hypothetical protein
MDVAGRSRGNRTTHGAGAAATEPAGPQGVRQVPLPSAIRALSSFSAPGYADLFTLARGVPGSTAEQWGRMMFEEILGDDAQFVWRRLMRMRLEHSPDRLAGWTIGARGTDWLRMEAAARSLRAELVIQVSSHHASLATFIDYLRPVAAVTWPLLATQHRKAAPGLLGDAHTRLRTAQDVPSSGG